MTVNPFEGKALVSQYYDNAAEAVRRSLQAMPDVQVLGNSDDDLVESFVSGYLLGPLEEDPSRPPFSNQEREFRPTRDPIFDRPMEREVLYAVIELPLVPRRSNDDALQLRAESGWPVYTGIERLTTFAEETT